MSTIEEAAPTPALEGVAAVLLVVDDDRAVRHSLRRIFEDSSVEVLTASTAEEGLKMAADRQPDVVLLDIMLPDRSGLDTFTELHERDAQVPVIFITAGEKSETVIKAMKLGAYDYLAKPLDSRQVRALVHRAIEIRRSNHAPVDLPEPADEDELHEYLVGRSSAMQEVYKSIGRVASQDVTVLIRGESGTGKELVARAIYQYSARSKGPFLAVNCAAIPETLLESELFGHEKGSFTGAESRRIGKFEQCSGGTLFMDEIGDMSPLVQSKVLRLLQEQSFERVGGNETIRTNVRIIVATNRDLDQMVKKGEFRADLYYRLNGFVIKLPPLRERTDDVLALLQHFLRRFNRELGKQIHGISPEALELLLRLSLAGQRPRVAEHPEAFAAANDRRSAGRRLPARRDQALAGQRRRHGSPRFGRHDAADGRFYRQPDPRRHRRPLFRSGPIARTLADHSCSAAHARQSITGRQDPRHYARQPAQ